MRLHYLAGDRTSALRQFRQCADALREELAIKPSRVTLRLYEQIESDELGSPSVADPRPRLVVPELLDQLQAVRAGLANLERQLLLAVSQ
jgi:DNA-binding SARP family transcriptional activator